VGRTVVTDSVWVEESQQYAEDVWVEEEVTQQELLAASTVRSPPAPLDTVVIEGAPETRTTVVVEEEEEVASRHVLRLDAGATFAFRCGAMVPGFQVVGAVRFGDHFDLGVGGGRGYASGRCERADVLGRGFLQVRGSGDLNERVRGYGLATLGLARTHDDRAEEVRTALAGELGVGVALRWNPSRPRAGGVHVDLRLRAEGGADQERSLSTLLTTGVTFGAL